MDRCWMSGKILTLDGRKDALDYYSEVTGRMDGDEQMKIGTG